MCPETRFVRRKLRPGILLLLISMLVLLAGVRTVSAADMVARAKKNGTTLAKGKLVTDSKGIRYRFSKDKTYAKNKWLEIGESSIRLIPKDTPGPDGLPTGEIHIMQGRRAGSIIPDG